MRRVIVLVVLLPLSGVFRFSADASHSSTLHWRRASNPVDIRLVNGSTGAWKDAVTGAAAKWSKESSVLNLLVEDGTSSCSSEPLAIKVCSGSFPGGWAGLTELTLIGKHIQSATIKLDDSSGSAKRAVACHEIGHALGLEHRPSGQKSSCLTATVTSRQRRPDAHDIRQLKRLYSHSDVVPAKPDAEPRIIRVETHIVR